MIKGREGELNGVWYKVKGCWKGKELKGSESIMYRGENCKNELTIWVSGESKRVMKRSDHAKLVEARAEV